MTAAPFAEFAILLLLAAAAGALFVRLRQPVLIIPLTRLDGTSDVALPDPVGARATEQRSG